MSMLSASKGVNELCYLFKHNDVQMIRLKNIENSRRSAAMWFQYLWQQKHGKLPKVKCEIRVPHIAISTKLILLSNKHWKIFLIQSDLSVSSNPDRCSTMLKYIYPSSVTLKCSENQWIHVEIFLKLVFTLSDSFVWIPDPFLVIRL